MPARHFASCLLLLGATALAGGCDTGPAPADAAMVDAPPLMMSRLLGRCVDDSQCPGNGAHCRRADDGFPGGQCTIPCSDRTECDDGTLYNMCVTLTGESTMECAEYCRNGSDCRPGYSCSVLTTLASGDPVGVCIPVCATNEECGGTSECNVDTGRCVPAGMVPTTGATTGAACASDTACHSHNCLDDSGGINGYVGGYCVSLCRIPAGFNTSDFFTGPALPHGTCSGTDSVCVPDGTQYGEGDLGICLDECTGDADCRAGYTCTQTISGHTFTNGYCAPMDCVAGGTCPSGTTCHQGTNSAGTLYGRCG